MRLDPAFAALLLLVLPHAAADPLPPFLDDPNPTDPALATLIEALRDRSAQYLDDVDPNDNLTTMQEKLGDYLDDMALIILGNCIELTFSTGPVYLTISDTSFTGVAPDGTRVSDDGTYIGTGIPLPGTWRSTEQGICTILG